MSVRTVVLRQTSDRTFARLLIAPAALFLLVFVAVPLAYLAYNSFFDGTVANPNQATFVGLDNYAAVVTSSATRNAAIRTVVYALIVVPAELVLGIAVALVFDRFGSRSKIFRTIFAFPLMIAPIVAGLLFKFLLIDNFGVFNWVLYWVGLISNPSEISWLGDPSLALLSVALPDIWLTTSFVTLVIYAGLQGIPSEVVEAARIDGAGYRQTLRHVTLPLLLPVIAVVLIIRGVDAAKTFDVIWLQTQGGPTFASEVLSVHIYRTTMRFGQLGVGAATGTLFVLAMAAISLIAIRLMWRPGGGSMRG